MAEGTPTKKKHELAGLPIWAWGLVLAGAVGVYILYKRHVEDEEAAAATGTTDENTGEPIDTGASSTTSSTAGTYSTFQAWEQAAISAMTGPNYNAAQALNDLTAWTNGGCVTQAGYNAIGNILETIGLPPGFGSATPTLSVCSDSGTTTGGSTGTTSGGTTKATTAKPTTAPSLPAALRAAMTNNGETVVSTAYDSALKEWVYLTNKGGIYTLNSNGTTAGTTFYGSYLGLPAKDTEGAVRTFTDLIINSNGTYTAVASNGQTYTFGKGTPQKATASAK